MSLLHLSELHFWQIRVRETVRNAANSLSEFFRAHNDRVKAECLGRVPVPNPVTGRWKRPRPEHTEGPARQLQEEDNHPQTSKKQATSATATSTKTSTSRGTLDELVERHGNFHDRARALATCLQKHDVSRKHCDKVRLRCTAEHFPCFSVVLISVVFHSGVPLSFSLRKAR